MVKIKLSKKLIKEMLSCSKDGDPLTAFYEYLVVEQNRHLDCLNGMNVQVNKVVVNEDLFREMFTPVITKFAKKRYPYASQNSIQSSVAFYVLDIAPAFHHNEDKYELILLDGWMK